MCFADVLMCFLLRVCCECDICIVHFSVWCFVFVGFSVMCEVHFFVFCVYLRAFLWCLWCDCVCILCCVTCFVLCYCVFHAVMLELC